jgi:hypothetical protein
MMMKLLWPLVPWVYSKFCENSPVVKQLCLLGGTRKGYNTANCVFLQLIGVDYIEFRTVCWSDLIRLSASLLRFCWSICEARWWSAAFKLSEAGSSGNTGAFCKPAPNNIATNLDAILTFTFRFGVAARSYVRKANTSFYRGESRSQTTQKSDLIPTLRRSYKGLSWEMEFGI